MDQNTQQPTSEAPPSAAPPSAAPNMPPTTSYPMSSGGGMVSQDAKSQAMLMWILTIFFGFIPGLIFFLTAKDKPFTYRQSALSLTWSILFVVAYVALTIITIVLAAATMGIGALFGLLIFV